MQKTFDTLTPQKKMGHIFNQHEDSFMKDLPPLAMTISSSNFGKVTLEMLSSPLPASKDLFAQLLASERKPIEADIFQGYEILEEDSYEQPDEMMIEYSQEEFSGLEEFDYDEENDTKKRKRKSTAQLKILKAELGN